jgi:hypothetical protein
VSRVDCGVDLASILRSLMCNCNQMHKGVCVGQASTCACAIKVSCGPLIADTKAHWVSGLLQYVGRLAGLVELFVCGAAYDGGLGQSHRRTCQSCTHSGQLSEWSVTVLGM